MQFDGDHLKYAFLAHLSKENNYPALAYEEYDADMGEMGL